MNTTSVSSPTSGFELREKVAALSTALLTAHPLIPSLLQTIRRQMKSDPENVTLLAEEEIQIVVNGLKRQTMTEITTAMLKTTGSSGKSLKKLTVLDL